MGPTRSCARTPGPAGAGGGGLSLRRLGPRVAGPGPGAVVMLGALGMVVSALIHLHLWEQGYKNIPTIGPLFLVQSIGAIVLAAAILVVRRRWLVAGGALFVAGTVAGFLLSVTIGLFGFKDSWSSAYAGMAFALELADLAILVLAAVLCGRRTSSPGGVGPAAAPPAPDGVRA